MSGSDKDSDREDSLTRLNTQLNKSMVLMEHITQNVQEQNKSNKSITINTESLPVISTNHSNGIIRKSILKKLDTITDGDAMHRNKVAEESTPIGRVSDTSQNPSSMDSLLERPCNLNDFVEEENLVVESTSNTFSLDDISDSEDLWIMDIPMTINPNELTGQTIVLGEKSKLKIGHERYCAINHDVTQNVTCVFNTRKAKSSYKSVNVKSAGSIAIRKKLSSISKVKPIHVENTSVPFPEHLKFRHPLFGMKFESKITREKKKSRKKKSDDNDSISDYSHS